VGLECPAPWGHCQWEPEADGRWLAKLSSAIPLATLEGVPLGPSHQAQAPRWDSRLAAAVGAHFEQGR
jgi:hypothetical protein